MRSAENVSSQITVSPGHWLGERCRIQIWPERIERHVRIPYQIRAVAKFARTRIIEGHRDIDRPAGLQSRNSIHLPVGAQRMQPSAQVSGSRYAPGIGNRKAMANVKVRAAVIEAEVSAVFWRARIKSAGP